MRNLRTISNRPRNYLLRWIYIVAFWVTVQISIVGHTWAPHGTRTRGSERSPWALLCTKKEKKISFNGSSHHLHLGPTRLTVSSWIDRGMCVWSSQRTIGGSHYELYAEDNSISSATVLSHTCLKNFAYLFSIKFLFLYW